MQASIREFQQKALAQSPEPPAQSRLARFWTSLVDALATWFAPKAEASVASTIHYFHTDHLGSSNVITDSTGTVVEVSEYTPYGSFSPATGSLGHSATSFGFTGQRHDSSTGLYFYNSRYYDPTLGRFTQPNSIVPAPSDPQALNRYSYVRNNPINLTDPSGHGWFSKLMGMIAGIFVTVITGGCISCGIAVYNFTDTLISARQAGVSWGRSLALAFSSAVISAVMPGGVSGAIIGGALQGAASAAILGGDIGRAAWTGAVGGALGPIIGGGVHSVLNGGSFGRGAAEGAYGAFATTAITIVGSGIQQISNANPRTADVAKAGQSGDPQAAATDNSGQSYDSYMQDLQQKIPRREWYERYERIPLGSVNKVPNSIKNYEPGTGWGNWVHDKGLHKGWQQRLPDPNGGGSYHLAVDDPTTGIAYGHYDAFNPMNGPLDTLLHGALEVAPAGVRNMFEQE